METVGVAHDPPGIQRISKSLYLVEDICNVYLLVRGNRTLLIDSGMGRAARVLDSLGLEHVDWVLHTHFHRDQCDGASIFASLGAKIGAPAGELKYFAGETYRRGRATFNNHDTYNDLAVPIANISVDRALIDDETFTWLDVKLQIVPAPGHTKGSIALVGEIDGRRIAFSGDAVHASGRPWTVFDLEWSYGEHSGVVALSSTLRTLSGLSLDVMLPAHGGVIAAPAQVCAELDQRLALYHERLQFTLHSARPRSAPLSEPAVQAVTPHVWMNTISFANTYAIIPPSGKALFIDCGFPTYAHFLADYRFVEHTLADLRVVAGLTEIDVLLPSHYHDDQICGLQHFHERYGAPLWVFEDQEDILAHPAAYRLPCLLPRPLPAGRVFQDGETFRWEGVPFTAVRLPGHTKYACAVSFEIDDTRFVHAGDTIGGFLGDPILGGPIFQNGFTPGDLLESIGKLRDLMPDYLLTGHWGALRVDTGFFEQALNRARALSDILWQLTAIPQERGFSFDPNWATLYPYHLTAVAEEPAPIEVRIVNHLSADVTARAVFRLPVGWICDPPDGEVTIPRGGHATLPFLVIAPATSLGAERHVIAAEVTLNGRPFGPVAEGILLVGMDPS
jgi:glyoxylase-like metal-dependent hydrolase (beta-lactamase superfamily II)